ncbi:spore coat protein [Hydrogenoanaerobacterium sp.]|uniref:spore coat protein n=1 Tax=Hydrogenoanaerobacterium sp. TaxID=2953763 RepID=UPI002899BE32|nr:spore coat protein [Hydrogenoanaerobacterium sp.]
MQVNTNQYGDKEMMDDALSSQKFVTGGYNNFANECATPALKTDFMNILNEEHQIQHELFLEMQKRGWYQVEAADQNKVTQAKQKYMAQSNG